MNGNDVPVITTNENGNLIDTLGLSHYSTSHYSTVSCRYWNGILNESSSACDFNCIYIEGETSVVRRINGL